MSRARSRSKAARWPWNSQLSSSTIELGGGPERIDLVAEDVDVGGPGREPVVAAGSRRSGSSSGERVLRGRARLRRAGGGSGRSARRPCPRSQTSSSSQPQQVEPVGLLPGSFERARSRATSARSKSVRATVVTGIPSWSCTVLADAACSGGSRCPCGARSPAARAGAVTSTGPRRRAEVPRAPPRCDGSAAPRPRRRAPQPTSSRAGRAAGGRPRRPRGGSA